MPMIAIDKNGKFVQSDGARHDGKGFGRNATLVDEGSVALSTVNNLRASQEQQYARDLQAEQMAAMKKANRLNAQLGREYQDQQRRLEVAQLPKAPATKDELLILGESMKNTRRDKFGNAADFSQWNTVPVKGDFGSHADFETYSTYSDPYIYDPYAGVPTDFDRYVAGKPIGAPQGAIPSGMGSADRTPSSPWPLLKRRSGQTNDDYARSVTGMGWNLADLTGINIDLTSMAENTVDNLTPDQALALATQTGLIPGQPAPKSTTTVKPVVRSTVALTTPTWMVGTTTLPVVGLVQKKTLYLGIAALVALGVGMTLLRRRSA